MRSSRRTVAVTGLAAMAAMAAVGAGVPAASAAKAKRCGPGLHAGARTSCALARGLLAKVGRDSENIADGRRVLVRSPVTGKRYAFFLYRADSESFTCRAYGDGVLTVRIDT